MIDGILHGDGTWPFAARIDEEDLVVRGVLASWFEDKETASGVSVAHDVLGCALPMAIMGFTVVRGSSITGFAAAVGPPILSVRNLITQALLSSTAIRNKFHGCVPLNVFVARMHL
jgi:hypothetical protein